LLGFFVREISEEGTDEKKEEWLIDVRPFYGIEFVEVKGDAEPDKEHTKD
jgi:hypothetical protein